MKPLKFLLVIEFLLLWTAFPAYSEERKVISVSGKTTLRALFKQSRVIVNIQTVRADTDAKNLPGISSCSYIRKLDLSISGRSLFVPRSVFADLFSPREVSIQPRKDEYVLLISGRDGANSYLLEVHFNKIKIIRRTLYSSLIPNRPVEETRYWLRVMRDE